LLGKSANTAEKQALLTELEDFIDEVSGMYDYDVDVDEKIVNLSSRDLEIATIFGTS